MRIKIALCSALAALSAYSAAQTLFDRAERRLVRRTLSTDVRMDVGNPPYADHRGAWQVRLTPEGSKWLYTYSHSQPPDDADHSGWSDWIEAKIAYDRAVAAHRADVLNGKATDDDSQAGPSDANFSDAGSVGGMADYEDFSGDLPPLIQSGREVQNPGPIPDDLETFMGGKPPAFASAVKPQLYRVDFGDDAPVSFVDQAPVPARYLYFRSANGVISGGTPLKTISDEEIGSLCAKAGIDPSTWHVMRAVSSLEGGFDSINTYDTGYISAGFIQFTSGQSGAGSLAKVLLREKEQDAGSFDRDFRRYGVDVTPKGVLAIYDPTSDKELLGDEAVQQIIRDKCLTAVFVHAGKKSPAFKVAQLELAKDRYYAGDDVVRIKLNNVPTEVRVCDVLKSEAGLATLMDRKVNTGKIDPFPSVLQHIADQDLATSPTDLAGHEAEIVAAIKYRRDFLEDPSLSQPEGITAAATISSRGAHYPRGSRKKTAKK